MGCALLLVALSACATTAQDRLPDLHSRFARDSDPIHRAKLMPQLGEAEFLEINRSIQAGNFQGALALLHQYRDEVRWCSDALDAKKIDAEKHPNGFKQLQISLRESLRSLNDWLVSFTTDEQKPFLDVRNDLDQLNRHLIHEIFPNESTTDAIPVKPTE
jgi:hypothetical protein